MAVSCSLLHQNSQWDPLCSGLSPQRAGMMEACRHTGGLAGLCLVPGSLISAPYLTWGSSVRCLGRFRLCSVPSWGSLSGAVQWAWAEKRVACSGVSLLPPGSELLAATEADCMCPGEGLTFLQPVRPRRNSSALSCSAHFPSVLVEPHGDLCHPTTSRAQGRSQGLPWETV